MSKNVGLPLLSVVVPAFNSESTIVATIYSVLNQSIDSIEVLVVDDGSTDNTPDLVKSIPDPRVHYEWYSNSGRPAVPRNIGLAKARGTWICFLDSDDIWCANRLLFVFAAIYNSPDVDVVCHNVYQIDSVNHNARKVVCGPPSTNMYADLLRYGNRLSTSATTIRRSFLASNNLRFNESAEFAIVEDYDLWIRIAKCGAKFLFLNMFLSKYILSSSNMTRQVARYRSNLACLLHSHLQSFPPPGISKFEIEKLVNVRVLLLGVRSYGFFVQLRVLFSELISSPAVCFDLFIHHFLIRVWRFRQTLKNPVHSRDNGP